MTSSTTAPTPSVSTPAPVKAGNGTITAAGATLLPLTLTAHPGTALSRYDGKTVTANSVVVQSSPAANGFWIGPSKAERIWVQLLQPGRVHPHPVRKGDHVSFTGAIMIVGIVTEDSSGGGLTIVQGSAPARSGRNRPRCSQCAYQCASIAAGSKVLGSSLMQERCKG